MNEPIINRSAYKAGPHSKRVTVQLDIMLDMVPGWGDTIEDHINLIFIHDSYVQSAQIIEPEPKDKAWEQVTRDLASPIIL